VLNKRTMRATPLVLLVVAWPGLALSDPHGVQLGDIDKKADPCADFFEYANGAWRTANPIPADMPRWSRRWKSGEDTKIQLRAILDETAKKTDWPKGSVEQLIGDFYSACTDEARANQLGVTPLKPLLAEIDGMKDAAGLQHTIRTLHDIGVAVPFGVGSNSDNHDPTQVIAYVFAGGLGLPDRDYYLKPDDRFKDAREKYHAHVAKMFELAGWQPAAAKAASEIVFKVETKLAENSLDNVALRDPKATDHKMSFADLQKLAPRVDWAAYFDGAHLPKIDLNVTEPKFLEEVNRQLADTPLPEWKTYLSWQLINAAAGALSDPFVEEDFAFSGKFLRGAKEMKPRWKRCVEATDQQLGEALGKKYVEKYFPPEAKARMQEMVKNLLAAMKQTIEGLDWMGPQTKKRALEKLATFNPKIGYPDKWKDYSSIQISRESYWDDQVNTSRWNVDDGRKQIGKPVDRLRWGLTPPTSDAYYNPFQNEIVFPAGILQPPAFNMDATDAVNYGAIGVVIGHEVSHGFDDQGAQYDAQGRLDNWWTPADLKRFQARGQCVVNQFDHYFIEPNIHHNGKLVLGESIGDLAGAKIAYRAYQLSRQGKPPEPTLDGYTPEQQFFIAWGQFRGDEIRPEMQRLMVQGDPHPIAKYRVIGPISNLPAFQKAFQCKANAPMVRPAKERCEVW
jgi:putative endopeptidase